MKSKYSTGNKAHAYLEEKVCTLVQKNSLLQRADHVLLKLLSTNCGPGVAIKKKNHLCEFVRHKSMNNGILLVCVLLSFSL